MELWPKRRSHGTYYYVHTANEKVHPVLSRVFMNGNSQAVRIPQEYRLKASQVDISRNDDGELIIRPIPSARGEAILQALSAFDDEFVANLETDRDERLEPQERDDL